MSTRKVITRAVSNPGIAARLLSSLDDALALLKDSALVDAHATTRPGQDDTLLEQCLALCEAPAAERNEPVRTVHHFACSGGSLICKCIGALANVQLLSEVDPLSSMSTTNEAQRFAPTDMVTLGRQGSRGLDDEAVIDLFRSQVKVLHRRATRFGQRLVLRDHAHSRFCFGASVDDRPTLLDLVRMDYPVKSVLTVRHPAESFAALVKNGWHSFAPATLDEYAVRYFAFLEAHRGVEVLRYEDFVADPFAVMRQLCVELDLSYGDHFIDVFDAIGVTGDSGRSGDYIAWRPPRPEALAFAEQGVRDAPHYLQLCERLGYPAQPPISPPQ